jgi:hypothetical protein
MHRLFTLDSARRILPQVRARLHQAMEAHRRLEAVRQSFKSFSQKVQWSGGASLDPSHVHRWQTSVDEASASLRAALEQLEDMGVQIKDLEIGLVDFPTIYRGREVLLCWRLGEPDISWWHGAEEGFRGRKPVDADFENHHHAGPPSGH